MKKKHILTLTQAQPKVNQMKELSIDQMSKRLEFMKLKRVSAAADISHLTLAKLLSGGEVKPRILNKLNTFFNELESED